METKTIPQAETVEELVAAGISREVAELAIAERKKQQAREAEQEAKRLEQQAKRTKERQLHLEEMQRRVWWLKPGA